MLCAASSVRQVSKIIFCFQFYALLTIYRQLQFFIWIHGAMHFGAHYFSQGIAIVYIANTT